LEFESLRQKIEREQENAKKLCENIVKWKKEAEKVRTEKTEAAKRKSDYQNKIAEENEKIPVINECITMFTGQTPQ
jgi:predicted  nucleic acid-binding Zn-ribbon protein